MKADRFEDLNIYKQARVLTSAVYKMTRCSSFSRDYFLVDQMRRSSVSVMLNIAEGFERKSDKEFSQFLFIAKGSCGELRAQLDVAIDQSYIDEKLYKDLKNSSEKLSSMISNLITYLRKKQANQK